MQKDRSFHVNYIPVEVSDGRWPLTTQGNGVRLSLSISKGDRPGVPEHGVWMWPGEERTGEAEVWCMSWSWPDWEERMGIPGGRGSMCRKEGSTSFLFCTCCSERFEMLGRDHMQKPPTLRSFVFALRAVESCSLGSPGFFLKCHEIQQGNVIQHIYPYCAPAMWRALAKFLR